MIPYYDMNKIHKPLKDEFMSEVKELLDTNNFVFGTDKFEEDFAEYTGAKYCVGVNSGTAALAVALYSMGVKPGDKVTTVSHTFTATINCNWVSPVKKREIILTGTKKSVIYDDIDINKIKIYNTGKIGEDYNINQLGDMKSPKLNTTEALVVGRENFLGAIENECKPMSSDLNFSVELMRWIDDTIL